MLTGPATVLIVEDNAVVRMGILGAIQDEGYLALSACNADEALIKLSNHAEIDVLFTDIRMPGSMDGLALANRIRQTHPGVEIIVASGNRRPTADRMPSRALFLPKPYNALQIGALLRELIDQTRPFVSADDRALPALRL